MPEIICNYATVRFCPYPETGEFANIGVVVASPQTAAMQFRVLERRIRRLTGFFPELDRGVFKAARQSLVQHLEQVQLQWNPLGDSYKPSSPEEIRMETIRFQELTRPRESLLSFGTVGTLFAASVESALDDLFGRYVERLFAHEPEYQETVMRQRLHSWLKEWHVSSHFRPASLGDDVYHVSFPFVRTADKGLAIKPLNLDRMDPSDISDHGDQWVNRVARLRRAQQLPAQVVFPVALPATGVKRTAAEEIVENLRSQDALVLPFEDIRRIQEIVTAAA